MPNSLPILIVGGFPVNWQVYQPLQNMLKVVSGRPVFIAPIAMLDWFGIIPGDDYSGVLEVLDRAVVKTLQETGAEQLVLLGHSAGGVLSRIYMGDQPYGRKRLIFNGFQRVSTLVTLGTPHTTKRRGRQGGLNQIVFAQATYPGAYWRFVRYVTIISQGIPGIKDGPPAERSAWQSYDMIAGCGAQCGDGIVPLCCGTLEGARHVVLEGVRHDPGLDRPWYGQNEDTICSWWHVVEEVEREPVCVLQPVC